MSIADTQYLNIVENILDHGYFDNNRTGVRTYKLPHQIMQFDLEKEFPILTTKFVAFKTAVKEILWIWQLQSNDVRELQKMNCHVWDEWMRPDGTIGKAYGYQIRKYKQVDKLLETLKTDPQNRRMIVSLWNIEDLPDMALQPCAYQTLWDVTDGRLNCMLIQRSGDMGLGVPFNMTQYAVLIHLIAQSADLQYQAVHFGGVEAVVRAVLAQLQVGHAVELTDGQVAQAAGPVEFQRTARVDAGGRGDRGAHAQVVAAVVVLHFREEDRLVALALGQRQLHADHEGFLQGQLVARGNQVAADLFKVVHRGIGPASAGEGLC